MNNFYQQLQIQQALSRIAALNQGVQYQQLQPQNQQLISQLNAPNVSVNSQQVTQPQSTGQYSIPQPSTSQTATELQSGVIPYATPQSNTGVFNTPTITNNGFAQGTYNS